MPTHFHELGPEKPGANQLAARLNQAIREAKITNSAVAEACGVTPQAVTSWRQTGKIKMSHLSALSSITRKPLSYWFGGEELPFYSAPVDADDSVVVGHDSDRAPEAWVPLVRVEVPQDIASMQPTFVKTGKGQSYSLSWLQEIGVHAHHAKLLEVTGESMEPTLYPSDRVAIDTKDTHVASGRVYAIIVADEVKLRRLFKTAEGRMRLVSDNPDKSRYPDEFLEGNSKNLVVVGRVFERSGPGGLK